MLNPRRLSRVLLPFFFCIPAMAFDLPQTVDDAQDKVVELLQNLIRIDTSNPPGQEIQAVNFIKGILSKADIPYKIYESQPGRGNIIARLKGDGTKKPILLVSHLDVVGVEPSHWTKKPFGGEISENRLYGRGAADMKNIAAIELLTLVLLKESGMILHRDVIWAAVADEESGGAQGMKYLIDNHWSEIEAEFSFNEGSRGKPYFKNGKPLWVSMQVAEKRSENIRVIAHGVSGHSMLGGSQNPIFILSEALAKIAKYKPPFKPNAVIDRYLGKMTKLTGKSKAALVNAPPGDTDDSKGLYSMMHNTINATMLKGGFRSNVVPSEAEALLNCRLVPGTSAQDIIADLKKVVNDSHITFENDSAIEETFISDMDSEATKAFQEVIHGHYGPKIEFVPTVGAGATDSRYLRQKGVQAYSLEPYDESEQNQHGNDESISISGLKDAMKLYWELVSKLAS